MICDFRSARLRDEKEAESQEKTVFADKGTKWQQSWTESDENFALSYPQNAHPADLVPLWPLPSSHPGQSCLVGIRNWTSFFWVEEGVFVVASAFKGFILKLDMVTSIFLNIFSKIVACVAGAECL